MKKDILRIASAIIFFAVLSVPAASSEDCALMRLDAGIAPQPSDRRNLERPAQEINVDGVPFIKREFWSPEKEGQSITMPVGGVKADCLYLLGCTNSHDEANPAWGGGDSFQNIFIGDQAGTVAVTYESGSVDRIPLVYGYTIWWRNPYNRSPEPFKSDKDAQAILDSALCVANGIEGGDKEYYLRITLRDEPVKGITIKDSTDKVGWPVFSGITFTGVKDRGSMSEKAFTGSKIELSESRKSWFGDHIVSGQDPYPAARKKAVKELARLLYTYPEDINLETVRKTKPDVTAANYNGPKLKFTGDVFAELFTNIYYENSKDIQERVDEEGMVHESGAKADNYGGFGGWTPGLQPFYDTSYTRLRALTLLTNTGFAGKVNKAIAFFDRWMMYFPASYPKIQLGGKPVPGHATVIANKPHVYFDELRHVGWPTKYTTRDFGNPENDGHGLLMLTRWRAWIKQGRSPKWIEDRWGAINEAAEYIPWCLDNPELSFSEHGLLYNESEGGMTQASMYCDVTCYLGLLGYAEMADAVGRKDKAKRWREQADRLYKAMCAYYPAKIEPWGDVWNPRKNAGFSYGHATLSPVVIGVDFFGYDVANHLSTDWLERTRRTYRMQLTKNKPEWCAPAGLGYGQNYITQAALLLDEMSDARKMLNWLAKLCFSPRQPHPYRVPEGATVASDGSVWRRWGDLGNLYQMAETVYTIHMMLGVDDLDASHLKLMPRIPADWSGADIKDWPVRVTSGGKSILTNLAMKLDRDNSKRRLRVNIHTEKPVDKLSVRVGPFAKETKKLRVNVDGKQELVKLISSGDSKWAWVNAGHSNKDHVVEVSW